MKEGYYWVLIENEPEIGYYYKVKALNEFKWVLTGSEYLFSDKDFKHIWRDNGPLTPPPLPVDFNEVAAIDPHPAAVDSLNHIAPDKNK